MEIGISIVISFILIVANGYFSMSEMALVNAKKALLRKDAELGDIRAQRAVKLTKDPGSFFAAIQVAITLLGFFSSAIAATNLSEPLSRWLQSFDIGFLSMIAPGLAPVFITLIVSYASIVIGELFPKRIGLANAEKVSKIVAGPLLAFQRIALPLVRFTAWSADILARLFRVKSTEDSQIISEEEIRHMVADNTELIDDEKRMIHEIIELGDTTVREIMQPRMDMILVEDTFTVRQAIERMRGTGYTRIPVYHNDYDQIVGIVHFKDLIAPLMDGKESDEVGKYAFEAYFVPETKDIFPLLSEMQSSRQQMAIVVDEYGGTDGLVTVEDIVEEIVGEIVDETDLEDKYITKLSDDEWLVDGRLPSDDAVSLGWPVEASEGYETIAGWLLDTIDFVPQMGEQFEVEGYLFRIQSMRRNRISIIRVKRLPEIDEDEENAKRESEMEKHEQGEKG